jgi:hypothetical protein
MTKKFHILLIVALAAVSSAFGASVRVSVSPQRGKSRIEIGDLFYLSIDVTDITATPQKPDNVGGAKLVYFDRTREESGFSSINGVTTRSYAATYTATMRATKEGSYSYGPVSVGGVRSNQVRYTIGSASATPAVPSAQTGNSTDSSDDTDKPKYIGKGDGNLFLRASVSSSTAYERQALVYTVKLYTTYDAIKFVGATAAPKFDGFVIEESKDISSSLSFETYQGKTYATAVIARYIIFPQMTGNLKVTGNNYTIAVDRREYYHDSLFGNMSFSTPLQLNVSPNDLVVNVKELPAPKPADFSGAVGRFRLTSSLAGTQFRTNQAASVVYTLIGTGNIKYVQMPDLSAQYPPEVEVYTPTTKQDFKVGSSNVSGTVTFDYSFMPLEEGSFRIPDVKLVYFDPETGKYETTVAKGYSIQVGKGSASGKNADKVRVRFDPRLQKIDTAALSGSVRPYIRSILYWLWFILPVVLLVAAVVIYRRYVSLHADMASFNSRRADRTARRRLKKAAAAMKKGDADRFYDELLVALWGYLGDKLKMPTSGLMRDNVRQVLSSRNVSDDVSDTFISIIDDAEFAKYSSAGGKENLGNAYSEATRIINRLENEFKN